ncbi:MAG: hypothetical protein V1900_02340 [Candidatus Aenigmatarchaeota archaeon]
MSKTEPKVWETYDLVFADSPRVPSPVKGRYGHADATSPNQALSGYLKMMGILRPKLKDELWELYESQEKATVNGEEVALVQIYPTGIAPVPNRKRKPPVAQKSLL